MLAYAQLLLLCAGLAAAAPAPLPHSKNPWWQPTQRSASVHHHHTSSRPHPTAKSTVTKLPTPKSTVTGAPTPKTTVVVVPTTKTTLAAVPTTRTTVAAVPTSLSTSASPAVSVVRSTLATAPKPVSATNVATGQLWQPTAGTSWQIILNSKLDMSSALTPDVAAFDIDLFINDASTMKQLKDQGKHVICYFSAGSYEPYRDDASSFLPSDLGNVMDGWPDEKWIDIRSENVRKIMAKRIQIAKQKGCDAIDPDNVDGFSNPETGVSLTEDDAFNYMQFLAKTAADNGMSTGLKNANALVGRVVDFIQFSINEQCHKFRECGDFAPFIAKNKPVFNIEYPVEKASVIPAAVRSQFCSATSAGDASGFSTVLKTLDLDGWVTFCDASTGNTAVL